MNLTSISIRYICREKFKGLAIKFYLAKIVSLSVGDFKKFQVSLRTQGIARKNVVVSKKYRNFFEILKLKKKNRKTILQNFWIFDCKNKKNGKEEEDAKSFPSKQRVKEEDEFPKKDGRQISIRKTPTHLQLYIQKIQGFPEAEIK